MTSDESRRFTDREVALVLRRASEIEESAGTDGRGGLSARDLEEIAREVGISQRAITQAIASLERGEASRRSARCGGRGRTGSARRRSRSHPRAERLAFR
jgi:DNA-binding transcriptional ArsR family regulator